MTKFTFYFCIKKNNFCYGRILTFPQCSYIGYDFLLTGNFKNCNEIIHGVFMFDVWM